MAESCHSNVRFLNEWLENQLSTEFCEPSVYAKYYALDCRCGHVPVLQVWPIFRIVRLDMNSLNRRQFVDGAGALLGSTLVGCGKQRQQTADSDITVFVNGTVLPVDATFSEHDALAISGNKILAVGNRVYEG